ncbi:hypothetical protein CVT25_006759 [Psilocybe cyanescens]|uniref:Uncharacterized protein n=1 Tax=Psilocybe cyanescens TaxID=93625 RepID=A0A409X7K0_PSICY|nr:hypothetical protein CVT25_006759 [Psilocybe cyanescens]
MVFRLPTQLETLVPPPYDQRPQPPPWRGSIIVSGLRSSDRGSSQEIFVTAVETDGENRAQQWPQTFFVRILHDQPVLREFHSWVKACMPPMPLCTFMPNRLRETNLNTVNQANFRSLSRALFDNQTVAIASWEPNTFPGAGMVIYPAQNSSAVLVGALFFEMPFPHFIAGVPSPIMPISPHAMQHTSRHPYQQRISTNIPYGSSPHHRPSLSPHHSDHNSPIEPIAAHRQDPNFRYIMPRSNHPGYNIGQPSSSSEAPGWTNIKDEDENNYAAYPAHQHPPYS